MAFRTSMGMSSTNPAMKKNKMASMADLELPVNCMAEAKMRGPIHEVPRSLIS